MSEEKNDKTTKGLKDYAGGWIQEREGTQVPGFLKLAFPVIGLFCCSYLVVYMNGETSHSERGALVQAFNKATTTADGLMYAVTAMAVAYVIIAVLFAIKKSDH